MKYMTCHNAGELEGSLNQRDPHRAASSSGVIISSWPSGIISGRGHSFVFRNVGRIPTKLHIPSNGEYVMIWDWTQLHW